MVKKVYEVDDVSKEKSDQKKFCQSTYAFLSIILHGELEKFPLLNIHSAKSAS